MKTIKTAENLKTMNEMETREVNGGRTYSCPFGCHKSGGYWSVYGHCLITRCFTRNRYLNALWKGAGFCFSTAFSNELTRILNVSFVRGKHARLVLMMFICFGIEKFLSVPEQMKNSLYEA